MSSYRAASTNPETASVRPPPTALLDYARCSSFSTFRGCGGDVGYSCCHHNGRIVSQRCALESVFAIAVWGRGRKIKPTLDGMAWSVMPISGHGFYVCSVSPPRGQEMQVAEVSEKDAQEDYEKMTQDSARFGRRSQRVVGRSARRGCWPRQRQVRCGMWPARVDLPPTCSRRTCAVFARLCVSMGLAWAGRCAPGAALRSRRRSRLSAELWAVFAQSGEHRPNRFEFSRCGPSFSRGRLSSSDFDREYGRKGSLLATDPTWPISASASVNRPPCAHRTA